MGVGRWVTIGYVLGGLILAVLLTNVLGTVFELGGFQRYSVVGGITIVGLVGWVSALVVTVMLYRNERIHGLASEVAAELRKVTWPSISETRSATVVVIITTLLIAFMLFFFDAIWSKLTGIIYA